MIALRCCRELARKEACSAGRRLSRRVWRARGQVLCQLRRYTDINASSGPETITINGKTYTTDDWTNVRPSILSYLPRKLHLQPSHPVSLTREIIEASFPSPTYTHYNDLNPVVTVYENFDSLGFPPDHPGRDRTDTYYINRDTVLRTHTSAHEAQIFRDNASGGYTISADVYRRDAIDRTHYPVFHQIEGARIWDRRRTPGNNVASLVRDDLARLPPKHQHLSVSDPNPPIHPERNPLQASHHTVEEAEAIAAHLKRSLEHMVANLFPAAGADPLQIRWVEAYFPFTSPSWELEVFWQGDWLEVLGCGVTKQEIQIAAGTPSQLGWAFGIGLERIAMPLFGIPDIRLFWSRDPRFLSQFSSTNSAAGGQHKLKRFVPFSKHPACYKDVAFWLPQHHPTNTSSDNVTGSPPLTAPATVHENDVMDIIRTVADDIVESASLIDTFTQPSSGRESRCYRVNYRSLERTLTNEEVDGVQERVRQGLVEKLGVELR